jgi:hypothetical protein
MPACVPRSLTVGRTPVLVLPFANGGAAGARRVGSNRQVDEVGRLGEASRSCGAGPGDGIRAGSAGWLTLNLASGRYARVCNEDGHYVAACGPN